MFWTALFLVCLSSFSISPYHLHYSKMSIQPTIPSPSEQRKNAKMGTSTIYSNSQLVVIDIGSVAATAPWLGQTTYLIDKSGHTTAVLAQTDQPTQGVTLKPVPYTTQVQTALPSTTAGDLPSGWTYRGCYIDYPHSRVLPVEQPGNTKLTVQSCVSTCYQLGYSVSSLGSSTQCFCGNGIHNGGTLAPSDSDCNLPCSGNAKEVCGAGNRQSVYSNATLTSIQPAAVQTSRPTTTAPSIAQSPTGATSRTPIAVTVAAAVIGVLAGIAIVVALVYYLRRRMRSTRPRTKSLPQISQDTAHSWPPADQVPSWEVFVRATEEYYARFGECATHFSEGKGLGLGLGRNQAVSRPSIPELREKYERLQLNSQITAQARSKSSNTYDTLPAGYSPPTKAPVQAHLGQPTSILKHPAPTEIANMAHGMLETEDERGARGISATRNLALAKKGVRFGVNQIREFGRSPFMGHGSES